MGQVDAATGDAFGRTVGERLWRRLAGAGIAVALAAALAALASPASWTLVLIGAAVLIVAGVPVSWAVERRAARRGRRWSVLRHVAAGAGLGLVVALVLGLLGGGAWLTVYLLFCVPIGTLVAAVAASAGLTLPAPLVRPVAVAGLVLTAALPLAAWEAQRPPAPYDFLVVDDTAELRARFGGAEGLADAVADGFEREAGEGRSPTAHGTWVDVSHRVVRGSLEESRPWSHYEPDDARPTLPSTGEPVRLVTVMVRGDDDRACVVVTPRETTVEPRACAELPWA